MLPRGAVVEKFEGLAASQETGYARERAIESQSVQQEQVSRETRLAATTAEQARAEEMEASSSTIEDDSFGIVVPSDFPQAKRDELQQSISELVRLKLLKQTSELKTKVKPLLKKWEPQGVIIDRDFINRASNCRKDAEQKTRQASLLKDDYTKALEGNSCFAALHYGRAFDLAAAQVAEAWLQTAALHARIPGRHWGVQLKDTWAEEAKACRECQHNRVQDLLNETKTVSDAAKVIIQNLKKQCDTLLKSGRYDDNAELSHAYKKIVAVQQAADVAQKEIEDILKAQPKKSSTGKISFYDPKSILPLEIAMEALKVTMQEAEQISQELIHNEEDNESEGRTTNESLLLEVLENSSSQEMRLGQTLEQTIRKFQQYTDSVTHCAQKLFDIAETASRVMTSGDVQFSDPTDGDNMSIACDKLTMTMILLDVVQKKIDTLSSDPLLLKEKQDFSIAVVKDAMEQVKDSIKALKFYKHSEETEEILQELQKLEEEHPTFLKRCKE